MTMGVGGCLPRLEVSCWPAAWAPDFRSTLSALEEPVPQGQVTDSHLQSLPVGLSVRLLQDPGEWQPLPQTNCPGTEEDGETELPRLQKLISSLTPVSTRIGVRLHHDSSNPFWKPYYVQGTVPYSAHAQPPCQPPLLNFQEEETES